MGRIPICCSNRTPSKMEPFLDHVVTGDEKWVVYKHETFRSIFAVTLPLVRLNVWDAQLAVLNDPRYARLGTNLRIGQAKEEY
ncbi:hypothetical protein TNCV_1594621 [Trichonephila clavipes]|nr:hypothetical protein TNCV_1594621 [Trichonephila clavipes]